MWVNEAEIEKAELDIKRIKSIAMRISKAAREAEAMGVEIFGGSGSGELRFDDDSNMGKLKLAQLDGIFDGGDGADREWGDGYLRGEY